MENLGGSEPGQLYSLCVPKTQTAELKCPAARVVAAEDKSVTPSGGRWVWGGERTAHP
jgi:hypothetical protein